MHSTIHNFPSTCQENFIYMDIPNFMYLAYTLPFVISPALAHIYGYSKIYVSGIYKNVTFLLLTTDTMENAQRFYEICHILLLVCTVAKAVKLL